MKEILKTEESTSSNINEVVRVIQNFFCGKILQALKAQKHT